MSEVKKIATRESYGNALVELGKEHEDLVVLDADLAEATKTGMFKKVFPERHIDCGIAECNMIGVAAGIAATGKVPFASSFAMFAAGRAFEQVRNSVGYPKLNVKIGATHAGISVGEDGATHQCNEDIALMRTIPGMVVISPADDVEARAALLDMAADELRTANTVNSSSSKSATFTVFRTSTKSLISSFSSKADTISFTSSSPFEGRVISVSSEHAANVRSMPIR